MTRFDSSLPSPHIHHPSIPHVAFTGSDHLLPVAIACAVLLVVGVFLVLLARDVYRRV